MNHTNYKQLSEFFTPIASVFSFMLYFSICYQSPINNFFINFLCIAKCFSNNTIQCCFNSLEYSETYVLFLISSATFNLLPGV